MLYTNPNPRKGLDTVIEADSYKVDAKFFTFLKDKEVVRSLKVDVVTQIRRMDDDEPTDEDWDDEGDEVDKIVARAQAKRSSALERAWERGMTAG